MRRRIEQLGWRSLPGACVFLLFVMLLKVGALQPLEHLAYNALFKLRGEQQWDDRLVLIAIDDDSIQRLGRFPWSRQRYTDLLKTLLPASPSLVAIDLVFSEASTDDEQLAQAMANHRVVLAHASNQAKHSFLPVPQLQDAATAIGHILHEPDEDGITRRVPLFVQNEPTFGLAAIQTYSLVQERVAIPQINQLAWINWTGKAQHISHYSFVDVLQQKVSPGTFHNKIVVVGVTATGIDSLVTPYDRSPPASGVHLNITLMNNLLQESALTPVSFFWVAVILIINSVGFSLVLSYQREKIRFLIALGYGCLWLGLGLLLFHFGYWMPVMLAVGLVMSTTIATSLNERLQLNRLLKRQIQELWQAHSQNLVVDPKPPNPLEQNADLWLNQMQSVAQLAALAEQFGRSQSTQAAIAHSLSVGLLATDLDGYVWFCNSVAVEWLNIQVGELLTPYLVPRWLPHDQWQLAVQQLQTSTFRFSQVLCQDDRWFELKLEPLFDRTPPDRHRQSASNLLGMLLVIEDITSKKQAEIALEQQVQELQHLSQLKDDFWHW